MIKTGVQQAFVLSPLLSLFIIDFVARHSIDHLHISIPCTVDNIFLVIVVLSPTQTVLWDLTMALENQVASAGLWISGQNTKVIHISYVNSRVPVTIDGKQVEEVANFSYLGSVNSLICRIDKASVMCQWLCPIWNSPSLTLQIKLRLLATIVVPMGPMRARPRRWQKPLLENLTFSTSDVWDKSSKTLTGMMLWTWKYADAPTHTSSAHLAGHVLCLTIG